MSRHGAKKRENIDISSYLLDNEALLIYEVGNEYTLMPDINHCSLLFFL